MLAIDVGNSRIKWAVIEVDKVRSSGAFEYVPAQLEVAMNNACMPVEAESIEVSCVANSNVKNQIKKYLSKKNCEAVHFAETKSSQCGVTNSYAIAENMGVDRWLAMIAAFNLYKIKKGELLCVIDCGTAITFDVLTAQGVHVGGLIMPGYQLMVKSLLKETGNIQRATGADFVEPVDSLAMGLASSTKEAVTRGCAQLVAGGLSNLMSQQQKDPAQKLRCIVTGGDGAWLSSVLNYENIYNSFLVLQGLNIVVAKE